jgi:hypothetical protein
MPVPDLSEAMRRVCLIYPWSTECSGVAPIVPTDGEMKAMWNSPDGLIAASGKAIPTGAQCESVQLVPVSKIGSPVPPVTSSQPSSTDLQFQFPSVAPAGFEGYILTYFASQNFSTTAIKKFIYLNI